MDVRRITLVGIVGAILFSPVLYGCGGDFPYGPTLAAPGGIKVAVSPANPTVAAGKQIQFTATVTGNADTGVVWSFVQTSGPKQASTGPGAPALATSGLFTVGSYPGTYVVTASSLANPYSFGTTTVTVVAPNSTE